INNASIRLNTHHLAADIGLQYEVLRGLSLQASYAFEKEVSKSQNIRSEGSFYTRNLINRFTQIDGDEVKYIIPLGSIVSTSNSTLQSHKVRAQLSYDTRFGSKHSITAFLGSEISHRPGLSDEFNAYGYNE